MDYDNGDNDNDEMDNDNDEMDNSNASSSDWSDTNDTDSGTEADDEMDCDNDDIDNDEIQQIVENKNNTSSMSISSEENNVQIGNDEMLNDNNIEILNDDNTAISNNNNIEISNNNNIVFNSINDKYVSGCSYECKGEMFKCVLCKAWTCCGHFNDKFETLLTKYNLPALSKSLLDVVGEKRALLCNDCIGDVSEPINEFIDYIDEYYELQYGVNGRNSLEKIKASDDCKWLIANADYLMDEFIQRDYNVSEFKKLMDDTNWMKMGFEIDDEKNENGTKITGLDRFVSLIRKYKNKTKDKPERVLLANECEIVRDLILLKKDIMRFICYNEKILMKKPLLFRKQLWKMINVQLNERYRYLKFIHDLEKTSARNETSMETSASVVGGIYTPNRRARLNENLKKKFVNKRTLSKNNRIRRKIVSKILRYHTKHYKGNGMLKYKRKNNIKYSETLDRLENLEDDRMGCLTENDLRKLND